MTPAYRSPWALAILSLLFERDMHPYEMRRLIRQRGKGDLVDLRPGSAYRTIERLLRAELIEPVETTREGRFPERTVYRITQRGRGEMEEWMRELLSLPMKDYPQLIQAVSVLPVLDPPDARLQLETRIVHLESEIAAMETTRNRLEGLIPRLFVLDIAYAIALRRAELEWVRGLVADLHTGRLTWDHDQLREQYGCLGDGQPFGLEVLDGAEPEGGAGMA